MTNRLEALLPEGLDAVSDIRTSHAAPLAREGLWRARRLGPLGPSRGVSLRSLLAKRASLIPVCTHTQTQTQTQAHTQTNTHDTHTDTTHTHTLEFRGICTPSLSFTLALSLSFPPQPDTLNDRAWEQAFDLVLHA